MKNKKVCVIGAGRWGKNHISTLNQLGHLGGIVEANPEVLTAFQEKYPEARCFSSVEEALQESFAGFTVATPAETHFNVTKKIIESGRHVLVEKPITMNSTDAIRLHELSIENNTNLMVGHVLLFHPAFQKIKQRAYQNAEFYSVNR